MALKTLPNNFAVFILSHGRANHVVTQRTIRNSGYTGKVFIIIDDEDPTADEYKEQFGDDNVIVFDKEATAATFDEADNFKDRRAIVYARNASFQIAKDLGIKYFIQLDDDYTSFVFKYDEAMIYKETPVEDLDRALCLMLDYYKSIPATSIAFAQNGDFIGGSKGKLAMNCKPMRKCMNTFICCTDNPFQFVGRINEDVNTYTHKASTGMLLLTIPNIAIIQMQTQGNSGGMTDIYLDGGTYVKSFYSVIFSPSCVTVQDMGAKHRRLHHHVSWRHAVPCIIQDRHQKPKTSHRATSTDNG